jgi:hypothetical protein
MKNKGRRADLLGALFLRSSGDKGDIAHRNIGFFRLR